MPRPLIGITAGYRSRRGDHHDLWEELYLNAHYFDAVERAGGTPIVLPQVSGEEALRDTLERIDGLVVSGGPDTPPARYGQAPHPQTVPVHARRDAFDFRCLDLALTLRLPILAVCYGHQLLNVHLGGSLIQDLPSQRPTEERHRQDGPRAMHAVRVETGTNLHRCLGCAELAVNSSHHQAIDCLGRGLRVCARSAGGIIEAIETDDDRPVLGIQWHPEELTDRPEHLRLFTWLVEQGRMS